MSTIPPLRKLQYVLAVARELHFRKAAEKLHVSQPAVSRQVRQCEEEFGFEILRRDHHFVSLTKAGQSFVTDLDAILERFDNDLHQAINKARQSADRRPRSMSSHIRRMLRPPSGAWHCGCSSEFSGNSNYGSVFSPLPN
jgi:DNA-binding transcriptional LysR family regulator